MIEVVSGTNRPGANALKIARQLVAMYEKEGAEVSLFNLQDLPQEIFDPSSYAKKPDSFAPLQKRILAARGLHIVTPEYNGSLPGVMKYFIDM
ncbi:MAG TPA: NAD(P)H-dependent oxidoreductase, partial [Candidatus Sumerlaeota bacterium]|nr:NAD(P)H-dependent oxidoreductase [Candidatus Sumerlaeota bacterium]